MKKTILVLVASVSMAQAANWTVIRRIAQVGACAASMADAATTLDRPLRETNPLLANANGTPNAGLIIGVKVGLCAGSIAIAELRKSHSRGDSHSEKISAVSGFVAAGVFAGVAVHNAGLK